VPITHQSSARYRRRKSQGEHFCTRSRQAQIYYQRLPCLNTILRVNILSTSLSTASQHAKSAGIACIIFTCYEYLAGNYKAADMHLQNGLRILHQHKGQFPSLPNTLSHIVVNTLYRFDLQAMTFSYSYVLSIVPEFPQISSTYRSNKEATDDLDGVIRCMMWAVGVVEQNLQAIEHPSWI
jgi:hypothetical protein